MTIGSFLSRFIIYINKGEYKLVKKKKENTEVPLHVSEREELLGRGSKTKKTLSLPKTNQFLLDKKKRRKKKGDLL